MIYFLKIKASVRHSYVVPRNRPCDNNDYYRAFPVCWKFCYMLYMGSFMYHSSLRYCVILETEAPDGYAVALWWGW